MTDKDAGRITTTSSNRRRTVLLTGASGVVGQALLPRLSRTANVMCLVHHTPVAAPNVLAIPADISQPRLGLTPYAFGELARCIDCIVHAAAITNFAQPHDAIRSTNVEGTKHVLELAAAAEAPLYHVSTAFVRPHRHAESDHEPNGYEVSKIDAEAVVRNSGLPCAIARPSVVIGDSATGAIARFQGIYLMVSFFLKGFLPVLPASPDWFVDVVPQDVVADAVMALIEHDVRDGDYWLTGGAQALSVRDLVELGVDFAARCGRPIATPRLMAPDVFDRLIRPVFLPSLPAGIRRTANQAIYLSNYLNVEQPFPTSLPAMQRDFGLTLPRVKDAFMRSIEYWASVTGFVTDQAPRAFEPQLAAVQGAVA